MVSQNVDSILDRFKLALSLKSDLEVAKVLGKSRNSVPMWRSRKSLPLEEIIDVSQKVSISLDWLLTGEGVMNRASGLDTGVVDRFMAAHGLASDLELALKLGIEDVVLAGWRSRGYVDYDLLFSVCDRSVSLNWVVWGIGSMRLDDDGDGDGDVMVLLSELRAQVARNEAEVALLKRLVTGEG